MSVQEIKPFFDSQNNIEEQLKGRKPVIFLDYDGTLTPIVETPDKAIIDERTKALVRTLSEKHLVAVVSGRATDDVSQKVGINNIFYAGSHGFEIISPDGNITINEEAKKARTVIEKAYSELKEKLELIDGALVEDVKYTISAHYRLVKDADVDRFTKIVDEILSRYPQLRKTSGKKVFELRPRIDWDKGKAVNWILDVIEYEEDKNVAVYVGDDTTDEDAFKVLGGNGIGILVAEHLRESHANYYVNNTEEVKKVLDFFIEH